MTKRIRWTDDDPSREYAAFAGSVGPSGWNWVPFGIYEEADGPVAGHKTCFLTSSLPGQDRRRYFGHPDDLKDEAEEWLAGFAASLGAVFPDAGNWHDGWTFASRDGDGNLILRYEPSGGLYRVLPIEET